MQLFRQEIPKMKSVVRCLLSVVNRRFQPTGGVIAMYVNMLHKQHLLKHSSFIFEITLDITFRLMLLM